MLQKSIYKRTLKMIFTALFLAVAAQAMAASPIDTLRTQFPALYKLYNANPTYQEKLSDYANQQGFKLPFENLATTVHEMIHIDSAAHQGYFIDGIYYEPYLHRGAWPSISNRVVSTRMTQSEQGIIYSYYVANTPNNHLGNVLDEINAYGHVLVFVCRNEPASTKKQVDNLIGYLHLQEAYLRILRTEFPGEYQFLLTNQVSRGALITITNRAINALSVCGIGDGSIPSTESRNFMRSVQ